VGPDHREHGALQLRDTPDLGGRAGSNQAVKEQVTSVLWPRLRRGNGQDN
jgi:hypothetical protein